MVPFLKVLEVEHFDHFTINLRKIDRQTENDLIK